jgi:hypothetical protein
MTLLSIAARLVEKAATLPVSLTLQNLINPRGIGGQIFGDLVISILQRMVRRPVSVHLKSSALLWQAAQ